MQDYIAAKYPEVEIKKYLYKGRARSALIRNSNKKDVCMIYRDDCESAISCGHYHHEDCINQWFERAKKYKCPYCQQGVKVVIRKIQVISWKRLSERQTLSEDFIREFQDRVDWWGISYGQKLSEHFIREFQDKVSWKRISYRQKLSEDFIREFQDEFDWCYISWDQKLSEGFISEFQDRLNNSDSDSDSDVQSKALDSTTGMIRLWTMKVWLRLLRTKVAMMIAISH